MQIKVTTYDIDVDELAALKQLLGLDVITENLDSIKEGQGLLMANFDALNTKLDEVAAEIEAAVGRVGSDVDELKSIIANLELDTEDQTRVDAVTERLQGNVDTLKGIDPVKSTDVPDNPDQPGDNV